MTKPFYCETCGEKDPSKFRGRRKSICSKCYNKRALKENSIPSNYKPMTKEEQKEYANDFSFLRDRRQKIKDEIYG